MMSLQHIFPISIVLKPIQPPPPYNPIGDDLAQKFSFRVKLVATGNLFFQAPRGRSRGCGPGADVLGEK